MQILAAGELVKSMGYEPTTRRNPMQLTKKQHFHMSAVISRFHDADGHLEIRRRGSDVIERCHSRSEIFCAKRVWDERAEIGYMKPIEDEFWKELTLCNNYKNRNHVAITKYWLLWKFRHKYYLEQPQDQILTRIGSSGIKDKKVEEIVEAKFGSFVREDGVVPSRFVSGIRIQIEIDQALSALMDVKWGLLKASAGELVVADVYNDWPFMPVTTNSAFLATVPDSTVDLQDVAALNQKTISVARKFYYARRFENCPF